MKTKHIRGSYRIGTLFGIGVYVHVTFLMLLAFLGWVEYSSSGSLRSAAYSLLFIISLFICLIMHEYGHALTARRFGIGTRDITLLPIGGVARLESMPEKPWQELLVAIAGPMVNVVIAGLIIAGFYFTVPSGELSYRMFAYSTMGNNFWADLARINILLILFNMLPAFPMDGGRVVRSLMAMVLPYEKATQYAVMTGRFMAILFFLEALGLNTIPFINGSGNFLLGLIGIFVWFGAGTELRYVMIKSRLGNTTVSRVMVTNFKTLSPRDTIEWVSELAATSLQQDFPVAEDGKVVGMLFQHALLAARQRNEPYLMVRDVMRTEVISVNSSDRLDAVLTTVAASGLPLIPVTSRGLLVGLLPLERIINMPPPGGGQRVAPQSAPSPHRQ